MIISFERQHSPGGILRCFEGGDDGGDGGTSQSLSSQYSSYGEGRQAAETAAGYGLGTQTGWTGTRSERDARDNGNAQAGDPSGGVRGSSTGFNAGEAGWGYGLDGNVYGDAQRASAQLGIPASQLGPNGGLARLKGGTGWMGLLGNLAAKFADVAPGYIMTSDERAEAAERDATRSHGGMSSDDILRLAAGGAAAGERFAQAAAGAMPDATAPLDPKDPASYLSLQPKQSGTRVLPTTTNYALLYGLSGRRA